MNVFFPPFSNAEYSFHKTILLSRWPFLKKLEGNCVCPCAHTYVCVCTQARERASRKEYLYWGIYMWSITQCEKPGKIGQRNDRPTVYAVILRFIPCLRRLMSGILSCFVFSWAEQWWVDYFWPPSPPLGPPLSLFNSPMPGNHQLFHLSVLPSSKTPNEQHH